MNPREEILEFICLFNHLFVLRATLSSVFTPVLFRFVDWVRPLRERSKFIDFSKFLCGGVGVILVTMDS